ncbi:hypothetical protein EV421DRAFT_1975680 [Armillaria borealis]|uniref:CCHC-type domain-containing protein n=1 Tax=Armillaria borealis TaxID=47425 RepID=A0AA39IEH6_9AGAR|nr:hypothetical protein EV421DRAFT_1975680 [Armillaria borealis]
MQISTDFSTSTLVAIAVTALSLTCALTTFVLYKTYSHEIKRLVSQFYQSIRHLFIPAYIERPGGVFVPNPRLYPVPERTPTPYHYVADPFREWEGPITFPPLFESQSSTRSSHISEQDVGQEGGHIVYEEYETIPSIPDTILPQEGVDDLTPRGTLTSFLSSPEFPIREPGIPIVIRSNSETSDEYRPHSPTNSEYERADTPYPSRPTLRRSLTPVPNIRRLAAANRAATAAEEFARLTARDNELAQLTVDNDELERTIARDRTITQFYQRASRPQLEEEPAAQSKQNPTVSVLSMSRSGSSDTDSIAPSRSDKSSQESLSLRGWRPEPTPDITTPESRERDYMSIWRSRRALIPTDPTWTHSEAGQAWMQADPAEQEDILSYSADVQATDLFNKLHPLYPYQTPSPYQSRFPKPAPPRPSPLASHEPRRRRRPASPQIHKQTQGMYLGPGRVQAGSGGAGAGPSEKPSGGGEPVDDDDDDDDKDKGKKPAEPWKPGTGFFKGDPPPGLFSDPVARDQERWSIPGAPDRFDPSKDPPNPVGAMADDAPWIGCKPDLTRKPNPFIGDSDDIDRFITDCQVYFQVYSAYMWLDSYRVAFAASYFEGRAKDWWTMQLADLYSDSRGKYRFPTWYAFKQAVEKKFSDPGVEEKHKVDMYALRMTGTMTATEYLQELEKLAKKAKLQHDTGDRGHMVTALRQGVPASYTTIIANMGVNIPVGYEQWGERIILMNEERQRKQAFDLMGKMYQPRPTPPPKATPPYAGASKGSSGATTSSADKQTASGTTYGGRGRPMDIDAIKSGNCFRCGKKGHISKNCPQQSWNKGKQEVRASTTEPSSSKIEEVKDDAGK